MAPGSKNELNWAGTCATRNNANHATRASSPDWKCGTRWQFRLARARNCTIRRDEVAEDNGSHDEDRYRADLRIATCGLLRRHVSGRASGLAKQQLTVSWQAHLRNLRNKLLSSGHGTPRNSRQWWGQGLLRRRCCRSRSRGDTE